MLSVQRFSFFVKPEFPSALDFLKSRKRKNASSRRPQFEPS